MSQLFRTFLITALFLVIAALHTSPAKAQDMKAAIGVVKAFLDAHAASLAGGNGPILNNRELAAPFVVDSLAVDGLQAQLGFDPVYNAQDFQINDVRVFEATNLPFLRGTAQVRVSLENFGKRQDFVYTLVPVSGSQWQISDIYSQTSNWSLSDMAAKLGINRTGISPQTEITTGGHNQPTVPGMEQGDMPAGQSPSWPAGEQSASTVDDQSQTPGMELGDLPGDGLNAKGNDLLFLLDGSGSMWGQIDGVAKISTARKALSAIMRDLKPSTNVGLMAYGHRREGDCSDTEILFPVANYDTDGLARVVEGITPRGKTPIAGSLLRAAEAMPVSDRRADVLLISDGLETCGGDPCAAAARLAERGINTRIHVVGFDLSEKEHAALKCIADNGNGQYFRANDAEGFVDAMNKAVAQTEDVDQAPVAPVPAARAEILFEEPFDGPALHANWQIDNPIEELIHFTDDGALFVTAIGEDPYFRKPEAPNRLILDQPLSGGDFDLVLEFRLDIQTRYEDVWLSVYEAPHEQLGAVLYTRPTGCGSKLYLTLFRRTGPEDDPEETKFRSDLFDGPIVKGTCRTDKGGREKADAVLDALATEGATLRLKRRGRHVTGEVTLYVPDQNEPFVFETEPISALRLSGKPSILGGHWHKAQPGESHFRFDRFAIEAPAQ